MTITSLRIWNLLNTLYSRIGRNVVKIFPVCGTLYVPRPTLQSKKNNEKWRVPRAIRTRACGYFGSQMFRASAASRADRCACLGVGGTQFIRNNYRDDTGTGAGFGTPGRYFGARMFRL